MSKFLSKEKIKAISLTSLLTVMGAFLSACGGGAGSDDSSRAATKQVITSVSAFSIYGIKAQQESLLEINLAYSFDSINNAEPDYPEVSTIVNKLNEQLQPYDLVVTNKSCGSTLSVNTTTCLLSVKDVRKDMEHNRKFSLSYGENCIDARCAQPVVSYNSILESASSVYENSDTKRQLTFADQTLYLKNNNQDVPYLAKSYYIKLQSGNDFRIEEVFRPKQTDAQLVIEKMNDGKLYKVSYAKPFSGLNEGVVDILDVASSDTVQYCLDQACKSPVFL
ncbi:MULTISPECIES: hypothetical protein [Cysteiniphilum]|uniref:hypothetical protein n=1 Tax=Cysteiniphilum TaxID=2056696 RepID=UPI00177EF828|nr:MULTISPECIES: hypothetical protein [Cysteiniphilum]